MLAEIQRAAAMRQPTHDHLVTAQYLLAIDAEILALLVRPFGNHQAPGNQRRHIARPAVLDRQPGQVDVAAFPHDVLAWRRAVLLGRHVPQRFNQGAETEDVFKTLGRLRFFQHCQHVADAPQFAYIVGSHAKRNAPRRTE